MIALQWLGAGLFTGFLLLKDFLGDSVLSRLQRLPVDSEHPRDSERVGKGYFWGTQGGPQQGSSLHPSLQGAGTDVISLRL